MDFTKKEERETIKILNQLLGTSHRTRPYDLNNKDDIIELLEFKILEYLNFARIRFTSENTLEEFDEWMENFHPATWHPINNEISPKDKPIKKAYNLLDKASNDSLKIFWKIEKELKEILKITLSGSFPSVLHALELKPMNKKEVDDLFKTIYEHEEMENLIYKKASLKGFVKVIKDLQ